MSRMNSARLLSNTGAAPVTRREALSKRKPKLFRCRSSLAVSASSTDMPVNRLNASSPSSKYTAAASSNGRTPNVAAKGVKPVSRLVNSGQALHNDPCHSARS